MGIFKNFRENLKKANEEFKKVESEKDYWKNEYLKLRNAISTSAYDLVRVLSDGGKYD